MKIEELKFLEQRLLNMQKVLEAEGRCEGWIKEALNIIQADLIGRETTNANRV